MLLGFYQYFGLYYCTRALRGVLNRVEKCWQGALRRYSSVKEAGQPYLVSKLQALVNGIPHAPTGLRLDARSHS